MAAYVPTSIAWAAADNRAFTILLDALPDALMRRFQAHEMRAHLIWTELQSMFERRDISSVGILFQEYFSITLATCDGAVDYVGRMQEVAGRLAARQAALSEPLQIHRLLFNLTPEYESRLNAFTEANPLAGLPEVTQWIIDTEVKLRTPIVNLTTTHSSSTSLNATQPRTQGGRNGNGGGRGGGGGGSRGSGRGSRGGSGGGGGSGGPTPGGSSSAHGAMSRGGGRPGTLPPCTYVHRHGPHAGTPCGQTNHPPATCFKALEDAWFGRDNTAAAVSVAAAAAAVDAAAAAAATAVLPAAAAAAVSPAAAAAAFSAATATAAAVLPAAAVAAVSSAAVAVAAAADDLRRSSHGRSCLSCSPPLGFRSLCPPSVPDSQGSFLGHATATPSVASMYPFAINETSFQYPMSPPLPSSPILDFVLDSGATETALKDAGTLTPLPLPTQVHGADSSFSIPCTHLSTLPCTAFPSGRVTGIPLPYFTSLLPPHFFFHPLPLLLYCPLPPSSHSASQTRPSQLRCTSHHCHLSPPSQPPSHLNLPSPRLLLPHAHHAFMASSSSPLITVGATLRFAFGLLSVCVHACGHRYMLVLVDDHSRYSTIFFLRTKDQVPAVVITKLSIAALTSNAPLAAFTLTVGVSSSTTPLPPSAKLMASSKPPPFPTPLSKMALLRVASAKSPKLPIASFLTPPPLPPFGAMPSSMLPSSSISAPTLSIPPPPPQNFGLRPSLMLPGFAFGAASPLSSSHRPIAPVPPASSPPMPLSAYTSGTIVTPQATCSSTNHLIHSIDAIFDESIPYYSTPPPGPLPPPSRPLAWTNTVLPPLLPPSPLLPPIAATLPPSSSADVYDPAAPASPAHSTAPLPPLPPPLTSPLLYNSRASSSSSRVLSSSSSSRVLSSSSSSSSSSSRLSSRGSSNSSRHSSSSTEQLPAPPLSSSLACTLAPLTKSLEPLLPPPFSSLRTPMRSSSTFGTTLLSLHPSSLTSLAFPSLAPPPPPPSSLPPPLKRSSPALMRTGGSRQSSWSQLQQRLKCKDLGDLTHYLGMAITRDRPARTITLSHSHYIGQILEKFEMAQASPVATPLPFGHQLAPPTSPSSTHPYAELVGSLMYAMMCTRHDLAFPISVLARFVGTGRHTEVHWKAAKRVSRWLCFLLAELGAPQPCPTLWCDNASTIHLTQDPVYHARSKHIELRYFFIRELVQRGLFAAEANLADIFTKALLRPAHSALFRLIGLAHPGAP
ncbi:unnamed protein product [Closterium sp. NIES-54]